MADKGNKNRKYGRNKQDCAAYRNAGRRLRNKARRMVRTLKRNPNDRQLAADIMRLAGSEPGFRIGADVKALCAHINGEVS